LRVHQLWNYNKTTSQKKVFISFYFAFLTRLLTRLLVKVGLGMSDWPPPSGLPPEWLALKKKAGEDEDRVMTMVQVMSEHGKGMPVLVPVTSTSTTARTGGTPAKPSKAMAKRKKQLSGHKVCAAAVCKNRKDSGETFHAFPKDKSMSDKWVVASKRNDKVNQIFKKVNPVTAHFCSAHFLAEDYERDLYAELTGKPSKKRLKKSAVPSRFLSKEASTTKVQEKPLDMTIDVSTHNR
jgi:hypothetical protein